MTLHLDYGEDRYLESHWHVMGMSWACHGHVVAHPQIPASSSQCQPVPPVGGPREQIQRP